MPKTIFITGADIGLGRSLTQLFAEREYHVFAGHLKPDTTFDDLPEPIAARITLIPQDVSSTDNVRNSVKLVSQHTDSLDILINNAGVNIDDHDKTIDEIDLDDGRAQTQFEVNALGPLRCIQQFLTLLRKGEAKRIINISSEAGSLGQSWRVGAFGYCMSKSALNMQATILLNHLGKEGFTIINMHPGWMISNMGGPDADITTDVAAQGIAEWGLKEWPKDKLTYIDYQGAPLPF